MGGELLIPPLVLIFGADIKTAGSASILISLGVVSIGLWRARRRAPDRARRTAIYNGNGFWLNNWCDRWRLGRRICTWHVPQVAAGLRAAGRPPRKTAVHSAKT
jgi:hypothetical protein